MTAALDQAELVATRAALRVARAELEAYERCLNEVTALLLDLALEVARLRMRGLSGE